MDSHFHGNDIRSNEIAALAFSKLAMTEGLVPAFAGMTYGEVGMTEV